MKEHSSRSESGVPSGLGRPLRTSDIFFAHLEALGIDRIFGNPGTTELPFVDGCLDYPSIEYVLSLHEDIAVAQAMGYARASGKPGVVNLHVTPGLGHGLSNIFNASRGRVPLLITVGQQHSELRRAGAAPCDRPRPPCRAVHEVVLRRHHAGGGRGGGAKSVQRGAHTAVRTGVAVPPHGSAVPGSRLGGTAEGVNRLEAARQCATT